MKKIFVIGLMCMLFMISMITFASAQKGIPGKLVLTREPNMPGVRNTNLVHGLMRKIENRGQLMSRFANLTEEEKAKLQLMTLSQIRRIGSDNVSSILKKYRIRKVSTKKAFRGRYINPSQQVMHRQRLAKAQEEYAWAKANYTKIITNLRQECNLTADECEQLRIEQGKQGLMNLLDMIIASIEKSQQTVESSDKVSDEQVNDIISSLNSTKNEVEQYREQIASVTTIEDLKALFATMSNKWKKERIHVHYNLARYESQRLGLIVKRLQHLETRLDAVIRKAEANSTDLKIVEEQIAAFDSLIASSDGHLESADKYSEKLSNLTDDRKDYIRRIHDELKAGQDDLKAASVILREITVTLNRAGVVLADDKSAEIEILTEVDESNDT